MKKFAIFSFVILALAFSAFGQKTKTTAVKADPAKDVRAAFDRLVEGIRQTDAAKVMSVYTTARTFSSLTITVRSRAAGKR
jgi:hypothetical protein